LTVCRELKEALSLRVSCKGRKRDCPKGIDMAKFKVEARSAWAKCHGVAAHVACVLEQALEPCAASLSVEAGQGQEVVR